jgi:hypothetical protein
LLGHFQGPTEKEQIDVQGDIAYDIVEFITETWPDVISSSNLFFLLVIVPDFLLFSCLTII